MDLAKEIVAWVIFAALMYAIWVGALGDDWKFTNVRTRLRSKWNDFQIWRG